MQFFDCPFLRAGCKTYLKIVSQVLLCRLQVEFDVYRFRNKFIAQ